MICLPVNAFHLKKILITDIFRFIGSISIINYCIHGCCRICKFKIKVVSFSLIFAFVVVDVSLSMTCVATRPYGPEKEKYE